MYYNIIKIILNKNLYIKLIYIIKIFNDIVNKNK